MPPEPVAYPFDDPLDTDEGWAKENRHYWLRDWRGYAEFFFGECFAEPHSTKQIEDAVDWSLETDPETHASELPRLEREGDRPRGGERRTPPGSRARGS